MLENFWYSIIMSRNYFGSADKKGVWNNLKVISVPGGIVAARTYPFEQFRAHFFLNPLIKQYKRPFLSFI